MSRFAAYFSAGYLPSLITTYYNQLDLADLLATSDNLSVQAFVADERDRFEALGFIEATQMRVSQLTALSSQMGFLPTAQPETRPAIFTWLNDLSQGVRSKLNTDNPTHQKFLMLHAAANNAGEIACSINLLVWVLRYLLVADTPELTAQWQAVIDALPGQIKRLRDTFGYPGLPEAVQNLGLPLMEMAGELATFPIRPDDKPYLTLLGRFVQGEYFNLLDSLEYAETELEGRVPAEV
ncbi:MAG: hypothetical protein H7338_07870 [Candidatus Sericytochromatia bacterium]|nr:hypothetical protein [Candidatus Sericytochromatia bacterium]